MKTAATREAAVAIEHTCRECGERFEVDTGFSHAMGADALHRNVECPYWGAEQRVNVGQARR